MLINAQQTFLFQTIEISLITLQCLSHTLLIINHTSQIAERSFIEAHSILALVQKDLLINSRQILKLSHINQ